ncbi:MAG: response regulator [Planctomycetota bacterium]
MTSWREHESGGGSGGGPRLDLLLVDDEEKILESLSELFQDRYSVTTAGGSDEALEAFRATRPQLVLCDQRMPGRTGIDLLREMREIEPGTIRMLITGHSDIEVVIEAVNDQILHHYVTKPWVNEDLVATVDRMARRYLEENGLVGGDEQILF